MRIAGISLAAMLMAALSWAATGDKPYPIFTPKNFNDNMKLLGPNFVGVNTDLAKGDFQTAKPRLIRSRELLAVTITFWKDRKKDDAVKILRDTLTKMDELDTALSSDHVDAAAATAIAKQIGSGCQSCHGLYREQVPGTKEYRFKSGLTQ